MLQVNLIGTLVLCPSHAFLIYTRNEGKQQDSKHINAFFATDQGTFTIIDIMKANRNIKASYHPSGLLSPLKMSKKKETTQIDECCNAKSVSQSFYF